MKPFVTLLTIAITILSSCAIQDEYKKADLDKKMEMSELISTLSDGPERQAFLEIMYSSVDLSTKGFKLTAKKKDFKEKGLSTYYYYAMKDSLKETYKTLTKGKFSVPEMPGVDWLQKTIETFNKQKEDFYAGIEK